MSEGEMSFSAWRDKVLKLLIDARVKGSATREDELRMRDIMAALGMTEEQCNLVTGYLTECGYARFGGWGGLDSLVSVTTEGIDFYERERNNQTLHIGGNVGAIYHGPVQGEQIQAVASAVNSPVQQFVESTENIDIRQALDQVVKDMVLAVQEKLTLEQLATYAQIAREFQREVAKENPEPGRLRYLVSTLSFLSDVEGTIQWGERAFTLGSQVSQYLPLLITLLARYFSS